MNRFILNLFVILCSSLYVTIQLQAGTDTHELKFHLIRYKEDSVIIPAIWKFNRRHTDSTLKRAATTVYKSHHFVDSNFISIRVKVYENGDTLSVPVHIFGPIVKDSLHFDNANGQGTYLLTGLTASRKKLTACVYRDSENYIAFKQDFHVLAAPLKPLPVSPTHPSVFATSPEPPILDLPIGTVLPYMGASFSHLETGGWFLCDGRSINSLPHLTSEEMNELITLFTAAGNPNPNNLPDLRGYFLRGVDGGSGNDPDHTSRSGSGHRLGGIQNEQLKSHNHTQSDHNHAGTTDFGGRHKHTFTDIYFSEYGGYGGDNHIGSSDTDYDNSYYGTWSQTYDNDSASDHSHTFVTNNVQGGPPTIQNTGGSETRPKNVGVNYIIKVRR